MTLTTNRAKAWTHFIILNNHKFLNFSDSSVSVSSDDSPVKMAGPKSSNLRTVNAAADPSTPVDEIHAQQIQPAIEQQDDGDDDAHGESHVHPIQLAMEQQEIRAPVETHFQSIQPAMKQQDVREPGEIHAQPIQPAMEQQHDPALGAESQEPKADFIVDDLNEAKKAKRVKTVNLKLSTEDYLEKSKPENTKRSIKTALNAFKSVLAELHPEEDRAIKEFPNETLATYLEEFFMAVVKEDGTTYNASTLGTYYNGLARYFVDEKKLDIKKEPEFLRISKVLSRRQEESVREGKLPGQNASRPIPKEILAEVAAQGNIGVDNPKALSARVVQCFEVGFGIRCGAEMYEIMNSDIKVGPMKQNGIPEFIELGERITKTRRGQRGQGARQFIPKIDSDDNNPDGCMLRPYLKMQAKKTPAMLGPDIPFFLTCKKMIEPSRNAVWFTSQRLVNIYQIYIHILIDFVQNG